MVKWLNGKKANRQKGKKGQRQKGQKKGKRQIDRGGQETRLVAKGKRNENGRH